VLDHPGERCEVGGDELTVAAHRCADAAIILAVVVRVVALRSGAVVVVVTRRPVVRARGQEREREK